MLVDPNELKNGVNMGVDFFFGVVGGLAANRRKQVVQLAQPVSAGLDVGERDRAQTQLPIFEGDLEEGLLVKLERLAEGGGDGDLSTPKGADQFSVAHSGWRMADGE